MHLTTPLLLSLPAFAAAQAQIPFLDDLKVIYTSMASKVKDYIPTAVPTVPGITVQGGIPTAVKSPIPVAAAKIASQVVHPLTMDNYEELIVPDPSRTGPTEWMVLVSGGNKTCGGHCHNLEVQWNETASVFAADPTAPNLGYINCDTQGVLCSTWSAKPPTIWHIQRQSNSVSPIHINYLNFTSTKAEHMIALHTGKKYENGYTYDGVFHPFDGLLKQYGVNKLVGYVFFGVGLIPSWAFMLVISMGSRAIISRRNGPNPERARQAAAQQAGTGRGNAPLGGAPPANE